MQLIPTKNGSHPKHNPTYYSEKQREKSPKATGNATAINAQREAVLKGILTNPNVVKTVRHHARFGEVLEYRIPGGQGARFTSDGKVFYNKRMSKFNIELSSVPDRENLVAEIWYGGKMIAEVNKESGEFVIELYLDEKITFVLDEFFKALENAKRRVVEI